MASNVASQEDNDSIERQDSDVVVDHLSENEMAHEYDDEDEDNHDKILYNVSSSDSTVPVGITIAYKRYVAADTAADETMLPSSTKRNRSRNSLSPQHRKSNRRYNNNSNNNNDNSSNINSKSKTKISNSKNHSDVKKTSKWSAHKSLQVLLDSSLIYIFCIIIPPFLAFVYHNIIQEITWDMIKSFVSNDRAEANNISPITNTSSNDASSHSYYHSLLDPLFEYLNEYQSYQYVKSSVYEPTIHYMCTPSSHYDSIPSTSYSYYTSYLWTAVLEQTGVCPPEYAQLRLKPRRSVISDDMSIYMDVFYITVCSFLLAIVRMMIVHYTIFKTGGNNVHLPSTSTSDTNDHNNSMTMSNVDALTVLVRCKSNHLLSSDYYNVSSTPDHSSHSRRVKQLSLDAISQCLVTNLNATKLNETSASADDNVRGKGKATEQNDDDDDDANSKNVEPFGYIVDVSDREMHMENRPFDDTDNDSAILRMNPLAVGISATESGFTDIHAFKEAIHQQNLLDNVGTNIDVVDSRTFPNQLDSSYIIDSHSTGEYILSTAMLQQEERLSQDVHDDDMELEEERQRHLQQHREYRKLIYAAPRYATAIFRLLYCTITAGIALLYFRHADFWPWFVFGTGRGTKQCWDLSGGITVGGMDSDFDQHNAVLKRYFLWQASYHIHSTTFHFLLSMIFLFYPFVSSTSTADADETTLTPSSPAKRLRGIKRGSDAYVRSFIQHLLSVVLIAVAYIFSSLRRLGAIGLFAFDVSSWSLHLLQICINAPDDSYLWYLLPPKYQKERGTFIRGLYLFLVIPSFVIARFIIWPALWYSVAYESQSWLKQLEMTLWPGSALVLRIIMHTLMLILHCVSLLYLRRLLSHRLFSK